MMLGGSPGPSSAMMMATSRADHAAGISTRLSANSRHLDRLARRKMAPGRRSPIGSGAAAPSLAFRATPTRRAPHSSRDRDVPPPQSVASPHAGMQRIGLARRARQLLEDLAAAHRLRLQEGESSASWLPGGASRVNSLATNVIVEAACRAQRQRGVEPSSAWSCCSRATPSPWRPARRPSAGESSASRPHRARKIMPHRTEATGPL